jgi:hypothetical protein
MVDKDTHVMFAQIVKTADNCKISLAKKFTSSGIVTSMKQVVVKPASTAAWVPTM